MKILASSVASVGDRFLHIGYVSAYARPVRPHNLPYGNSSWEGGDGREIASPILTLDVRESLRLKDESTAAAITQPVRWQPDGFTVVRYEAIRYSFPIVGVAVCLACVALFYRLRKVRPAFGQLLAALALTALGLASLGMAVRGVREFSNFPSPSLPPPSVRAPWQDFQPLAYADPEKATLALLHCVVADALRSTGPVEDLAQLQNEVGLPTAELTPGMRYALKTYGLDGWGRPFRMTSKGIPSSFLWRLTFDRGKLTQYPEDPIMGRRACYLLASAGADGQFDTPDDITVSVEAPTERRWDSRRYVFFLTKDKDQYVLLFHRWAGRLFKYGNAEQAQRLTGGLIFDALPVQTIENQLKEWFSDSEDNVKRTPDLEERLHHLAAFKAEYDAKAAASPDAAPLLVQVFEPRKR